MAEPTLDRDKLAKPFPQEAIKHRDAPGSSKQLAYVSGHTVIHRLNDAAPFWDFTIKEIVVTPAGTDAKGNPITLVRAQVALTIPGMGTREHIGVQAVRMNSGEDLAKGAITDALKKAATLFGVGLELYGPDYEDDAPVTHQDAPGRNVASIRGSNANESVDTSTGEIIPNRGPAASEKQIKWIRGLGKGRGYVMVGDDGQEHTHEQQLTDAINREFGTTYTSVDHLSKTDASRVIDKWAPPKEERPQRDAAPTPIRQTVTQEPPEPPADDWTSWTSFWKYARENGVESGPKFTELTQRSLQTMSPEDARQLLVDTFAAMPKAGAS